MRVAIAQAYLIMGDFERNTALIREASFRAKAAGKVDPEHFTPYHGSPTLHAQQWPSCGLL
jgi:hypothetical protein